MSRIGNKPIPIPKEVDVKFEGDLLTVKGPKGELKRIIHPGMRLSIDKEKIAVAVSDESRDSRALHGLFRMLIFNMVTGVTKGFERALEIVGVGYRVELKGRTAVFNLGYSHSIDFELPEGIEAKIDKMRITLNGMDKELLGMTSARIRSLRKPEPYKGKGIRYVGEIVRKKAGKSGAV